MVRMGVIAVAAAMVSSLATAQMAPPPPPPPAPNILGDKDKAAGDPMIGIRAREEVEKKRYEGGTSTPAQLGKSRPAKAEDVQAGKTVNDSKGVPIALVNKVEADGVILSTGASSIKVPLEAFGVNKKGLLLDVTKPQFDELVASANVTPKS